MVSISGAFRQTPNSIEGDALQAAGTTRLSTKTLRPLRSTRKPRSGKSRFRWRVSRSVAVSRGVETRILRVAFPYGCPMSLSKGCGVLERRLDGGAQSDPGQDGDMLAVGNRQISHSGTYAEKGL